MFKGVVRCERCNETLAGERAARRPLGTERPAEPGWPEH
jgi:hypothetical protein